MQRRMSTKNSFYFIYWCYKAVFYSTCNPLASAHTARLVGRMSMGAAVGRGLANPANSSLLLAVQQWVGLQSPAPCHGLRLPRSVPVKVERRALARRGGTFPWQLPHQGLYCEQQVRRDGALAVDWAALRCTAQGKCPLVLSAGKS